MSDSKTPIRSDALLNVTIASARSVTKGTLTVKAVALTTRLFLRRERCDGELVVRMGLR
jgi:hypothetical protein